MKQPSISAITIEIANEQADMPLERRLLRRAVRTVLRDAGVRKARISVAVVDDETMARLNWRYLRHRGPADVLSFVLDEGDGLEGEVIVTPRPPCGLRRSMVGRRTTNCCCTSIHGTLHLVGHDDASPALRAEMQQTRNGRIAKTWNNERDKPGND